MLLAGTGSLFWHLGWPQKLARHGELALLSVTKNIGFELRDVTVTGRVQAQKDALYDAIGAARGMPIFAFDPELAAQRLRQLPWLANVIIERRLPDTISVTLFERAPIARWQHERQMDVLDENGHPIPDVSPDSFAPLPLVVGTGADSAVKALLSVLKTYPTIQEKTDSAVRVGERRWDLHLKQGIIVRLPEQDVGAALRRLSILIEQQGILDRAIATVDLRLSDRLTIEPLAPVQPAQTKRGVLP